MIGIGGVSQPVSLVRVSVTHDTVFTLMDCRRPAGEALRCDVVSLSWALMSEFMLDERLCLSEVGESGGV